MNIWFIFWSRTTEHDVSISSAFGIMQWFVKNTDHKVFPIYITTSWQWVYEPWFLDKEKVKELPHKDYSDLDFSIDFSKTWKFHAFQRKKSMFWKNTELDLDVMFLMLHGKNWEDWSVQWIMEILDVPYVSTGVLWSSVWMNKVVMKDVFKANNIPCVRSISLCSMPKDLHEIEESWYPIIVKPANLWSSIWVSKVTNKKELEQWLEVAFFYDSMVICEKAVENLVELNCSILIDKGEIKHSVIEKVWNSGVFLSFDEKYIHNWWTMQWIEEKVQIPAKIPHDLETKIYEICERVGKIMMIDWWAPRIDFLWDEKNNDLYVNEINTIPWAMQLHLWQASGMWIDEFFKILLDNAFYRQELKNKKSVEFSSSVIDLTVDLKK